jgi:hypothetical protein
MEQIQLLYLGNTKDGLLTKYPARDVNGTLRLFSSTRKANAS